MNVLVVDYLVWEMLVLTEMFTDITVTDADKSLKVQNCMSLTEKMFALIVF
jgi:hypothetical protein